jgi:hypothetical protein
MLSKVCTIAYDDLSPVNLPMMIHIFANDELQLVRDWSLVFEAVMFFSFFHVCHQAM